MIEGIFDADKGTIEWQGVVYKLKGFIDTRKYNKLDVINQMANDFYAQYGRNAIVYTNKGIWDKIVDNAGLKDNICEKTTLFLAWFGVVPPDYSNMDSRKFLPTGWYGYELWNDSANHYKLMAGDSMQTFLSYCYLATAEEPEEDDPISDPTTTTSVVSGGLFPLNSKTSIKWESVEGKVVPTEITVKAIEESA